MGSIGLHCMIIVWHTVVKQIPYVLDSILMRKEPSLDSWSLMREANLTSEGERGGMVIHECLSIDRYALITGLSVHIIAHAILLLVINYKVIVLHILRYASTFFIYWGISIISLLVLVDMLIYKMAQ